MASWRNLLPDAPGTNKAVLVFSTNLASFLANALLDLAFLGLLLLAFVQLGKKMGSICVEFHIRSSDHGDEGGKLIANENMGLLGRRSHAKK